MRSQPRGIEGVGRDAAVDSQALDRRETPDISERLQYLGCRVALSGGAGGPNLSVELLVNMDPSHSRPEGVRGGALTASATGHPLH